MGNFFQQLGLQAGYNIIQNQDLQLNSANLALKQQQVDMNKLDMLQKGQILQARKEIAQSAAQSMKADNTSVTDSQKQIDQQEKAALILEGAGDFEGARSARETAKTLRQNRKAEVDDVLTRVKTAKGDSADRAYDYTENPNAETASAFESSYIKAGGNPALLPKPGTEEYFKFAKQQRRSAMTAEKKVEDDQKESDRKDKEVALAQHQKEETERKIQDSKDRIAYQNNLIGLREETLQFRKQMAADKAASGADGKGKASGGVYDRAAVSRLNTSSKEAAQSIENLALLSKHGSVALTAGVWDHFEGTGAFSAPLKAGTNEVNDPTKAMYTSIMIPLMRTAATVQGSGYYKLSDSQIRQESRALINEAGQSHMVLLEKMAELKQTVVLGQESALDSTVPNEAQRKTIQTAHDSIEKSIPWEVADVIKFQHTGKPVKEFGKWLQQHGSTPRYDQSKGSKAPAGKVKTADDVMKHFGLDY